LKAKPGGPRINFSKKIDRIDARDHLWEYILIFERHLPQTVEFVDRYPQQVFILDRVAKPRIEDGLLSLRRQNILELARENVYCKLSPSIRSVVARRKRTSSRVWRRVLPGSR
jgi:predicted TIM-barrel fold metal-dependent hydrolase